MGNIINEVPPFQQPVQQQPNPQPMSNDLDHIYNEEVTTKETPKEIEPIKKEPGFVSYVLLGVIVAVLSLVFLYMIL